MTYRDDVSRGSTVREALLSIVIDRRTGIALVVGLALGVVLCIDIWELPSIGDRYGCQSSWTATLGYGGDLGRSLTSVDPEAPRSLMDLPPVLRVDDRHLRWTGLLGPAILQPSAAGTPILVHICGYHLSAQIMGSGSYPVRDATHPGGVVGNTADYHTMTTLLQLVLAFLIVLTVLCWGIVLSVVRIRRRRVWAYRAALISGMLGVSTFTSAIFTVVVLMTLPAP